MMQKDALYRSFAKKVRGFIEIPECEKWSFDNKAALKQIKHGLIDSSEGRLVTRGSFIHYKDEEIE